jgi:hypothetical protein
MGADAVAQVDKVRSLLRRAGEFFVCFVFVFVLVIVSSWSQ